MELTRDILKRLNRLTHEIVQIKATLVDKERPDSRTSEAYKDFTEASKEVSSRWSGDSARDEIRAQRQ